MISFCEISSHKFFYKHPCVSKIDFDYLQVHFVLDLSVVCLLKYSRDSSLQITVISHQSSLPIIFLSKKQRFTISSITFLEKWPFCSYPLISWRILSRATSIMVHIWFTGTIVLISLIIFLNRMLQSSDSKSWIWRNIPKRGTYSVLERVEWWKSKECNCILSRLNSKISSAMHTLWSQNGGWLMKLPRHPISLGQRRNVTKSIDSCAQDRPDHFFVIIAWMRHTVNNFMGSLTYHLI